MNELKKIDLDEELKEKLLENRKYVLFLLDKDPKTKEDYHKLNLCKKRIKYIIKKLIEKIKKENLTKKPKKNILLPKSLEDKKILYRYVRSLEIKIRQL